MSTARRPRSPALAAALVPLALAGCATTFAPRAQPAAPPGDLESTMADLAAELLDGAALRAGLSTMRVLVHPLERVEPGDGRAAPAASVAAPRSPVAAELEAELVLALSGRLHLIDVALVEASLAEREGEPIPAVARELGATHVVLGDYAPHGAELVVTVRLVDAESLVIVSAARRRVPLALLSELPRATAQAAAPAEPAPRAEAAPEREPAVGEASSPVALAAQAPTEPPAEEAPTAQAPPPPAAPAQVPVASAPASRRPAAAQGAPPTTPSDRAAFLSALEERYPLPQAKPGTPVAPDWVSTLAQRYDPRRRER